MSAAGAPKVVVCAGGGGVGKTTFAAAVALALARRGFETLVVTIDPARRLAGAMGVPITDEVSCVQLGDACGHLHALMPDPRRSLRTFIEQLFEGEPGAKERMLKNRIYLALSDAAAGVHELVAMNLVARASSRGAFEFVVIDTAPSRHAIDFVTYPGRLAALLGGRKVGWLAGLAKRAGPQAGKAQSGIVAWGTGRVERLLSRVTGPNLVRETAALFSDLAIVRERFVALARLASDLLLGERSAYALVAAPTAAARDDVLYLARRLQRLGRTPRAIVLNRADSGLPPYADVLGKCDGLPPSIRDALAVLKSERNSRTAAADAISLDLRGRLPALPIVRLPFVEAAAPEAIVAALSKEIEPAIETLLPEG